MSEAFIRKLAKKHGWVEIPDQKDLSLLSFRKQLMRINVWYTKMTVGTCLLHPVKGKTQLFRRNIWSEKVLEKIFINPRVHTHRGYYER